MVEQAAIDQLQDDREKDEARGMIEEMQLKPRPELPKPNGDWAACSGNTNTPVKKGSGARTTSWTRCGR